MNAALAQIKSNYLWAVGRKEKNYTIREREQCHAYM